MQTATPPVIDRSPFLSWAAETGDALDAQAHLDRFDEIVAGLEDPDPPSPSPLTTTVSVGEPDARYPEPATQLRLTAGILAGAAISAVLVAVAAKFLRRRSARP